jgi:hypothetical protein
MRVILCYNLTILSGVLLAAKAGREKGLVQSLEDEGWRMIKS